MFPVLAAAHLLGLTGLVLLGGGVWTRRSLTPAHPSPGWLGAGFLLTLLGSALEVGWTLRDLGFLTPGDAAAYLTGTAAGRPVLLRVLGAALLLAAERFRSAWPTLLPALAAAAWLWGEAGSGHGAAHGVTARLVTALHAGAMTVWLGGVLALLRHPAPGAELARRFMPVALGCVAVLVVSGAGLTLEHAGTPGAAGPYGGLLRLKLALFALALVAALGVRRALARGLPPRRRLAAETLLLLAVLLVTAALGTTPAPTTHTHGSGSRPGHPGTCTDRPLPPAPGVTAYCGAWTRFW